MSIAAGALRGQRVLVTGGSGFIGRHVVATLTAAGARVRVVDLQAHPDPSVDIVRGDIADPEVIDQAFDGGFDGVVHLAAVTSVLRSVQRPELTYQTNVAGTHRVLEGARASGVRALVFASTNAVTGPMLDPAITERASLRPLTPYGATKAAGEMMMSAYTAAYGIRCTALRLTNVYGPGMQAKDSIVARLMRAIRLRSTFEVYGDGLQVRDYVHVADVVGAMLIALTNATWSGPVVIGSGTSLSVLDVIDVVRRVSGCELPVTHGPARPGEMPAVIVDPACAHAAGWSPQFSFATGVTGVWEEWQALEIEGALAFHGAGAPPAAAIDGRRAASATSPVPPLKRAAAARRRG
ncbi:MAG TPA: NAD-dependent epimerase/dehydratase family protein [Solirubrobacteraceae bacterium]|nr:NAD-dependent epimerase/dehydratase family protein [Solirubrobacteraceae bacterium]